MFILAVPEPFRASELIRMSTRTNAQLHAVKANRLTHLARTDAGMTAEIRGQYQSEIHDLDNGIEACKTMNSMVGAYTKSFWAFFREMAQSFA